MGQEMTKDGDDGARNGKRWEKDLCVCSCVRASGKRSGFGACACAMRPIRRAEYDYR